jgi:hypothetical protein
MLTERIIATLLAAVFVSVASCATGNEQGRLVYSSHATTADVDGPTARILFASLRLKGYTADMTQDWNGESRSFIRATKSDETVGTPLAGGAIREVTVTPIKLDSSTWGVDVLSQGWYKPALLSKNPWSGAAELSREMTREQDWVLAVLAGERQEP